MKTYYTFKNINRLQGFLRSKGWKAGELDYITIGKKVFTLHEFDHDGQYMSWGNQKYNTLVECTTSNRYNTFKDAVIRRFPQYGLLRMDINYAQ